MKKITISTVAFLIATSAAFADATIAVGQTGRGYEAFGKDMAIRISDRIKAVTVNYDGSDSISKAVCDGKAEVGITQIDGIYARQAEGCKLKVAGIYGTEYAYLMFPPGSAFDELSDLTANSKVQVDTVGSGTDLFWHTIVGIENGPDGNKSGWQLAEPVNDISSLAQSNAAVGAVDAVLFVAGPNSADVRALYDAGWTLASFYDKDLNDLMFNGDSLYPIAPAVIADTGGVFSGDVSNDSFAVRSFVVLNQEAAKDRVLLGAISTAALALKKN